MLVNAQLVFTLDIAANARIACCTILYLLRSKLFAFWNGEFRRNWHLEEGNESKTHLKKSASIFFAGGQKTPTLMRTPSFKRIN